MSDLSAFYAQNAGTVTIEDFVVSTRFKDKDGSPLAWQLCGMTEAQNEEIRAAATKRVQVKKGVTVPETNPNEYMAKLVVASVAFPNLKDASLQESYGVRGAEDLLRKMLLPGEYSSLAEKVQQINGFDKDMNELVDEVKN
ncbi:phage portal protein [Paenibacillus sp. FSL H7-0331]|uniref:phage tail assembly chaperone n=1 Tax=Paenibacillus sp. FSL H7-0331 TaxID=1920421 RepID=UPI00096D6F28|nr:phage portal protein [Paenibacillus sp. FSL H7-0331]OMF12335.1 phage portal protein [Paenibacillus sp. FSL H7-0331]